MAKSTLNSIGQLLNLWDQGIGEGNLSKIQVICETIEGCRRPYRLPPRFLRDRRQENKGQLQDLAVNAGSV